MGVELQAGGSPWPSGAPRQLTAGGDDAGKRLDAFLAEALGVGRRTAARLVSATRVNGRRAAKGDRLAAGDEIAVSIGEPGAGPSFEPSLVRATPDVLVINKPAGLPSVEIPGSPRDSLARWIAARFPECAGVGVMGEHGLAHRLDNQTSGLVLVARSPESYQHLRSQFSRHEIVKTYLAVVWGRLEKVIQIDAPVGQHQKSRRRVRALASGHPESRYTTTPASTGVTPLRTVGPATVVSATTSTGARHQIRVHLAFAGHPLVGDPLYAGGLPQPFEPHLLHASALSWKLPDDGTLQNDECPPPDGWQAALDRLAHVRLDSPGPTT